MDEIGGKLLLSLFYGFMGTVVSLDILWALLNLTIGISIPEDNGFGFLVLVVWGCWIVGVYLYLTNQEELYIQDEVERLRDSEGKSVSPNAFTRLAITRLNDDREKQERRNAEQRIGRALTDTEWEEIKCFRKKQIEALDKENKEQHGLNESVLDSLKWHKKRQVEDGREYNSFLKRYEVKHPELPVPIEDEEQTPRYPNK